MLVCHDATVDSGKCIVYAAINRVNAKSYIGATEKGLEVRRTRHFANARRGQLSKFYTAIRKYGEDKFNFVVLQNCKEFFHALNVEREYIALLKPEYNMTEGGGGVKGLKFSDVSREKMSLRKRGKPSHRKGKSLTLEQRDAISRSVKAHAEKLKSVGLFPHDHMARLTKAGNAARRRKVICLGDGRCFDSVTEAAAHYGLTTGRVSYSCQGTHKSRRNLQFRHVETPS